jgi:4-diphosphocytidyl-2-C-methyl-D-erythritol kinase
MASPLILSWRKQKEYWESRIKLLSPAKLNLYLNILGKYKDGFHRIESIIERISLFDVVSIRVRKDPQIKVDCSERSIQGEKNLCFKTIELLKKEFKIPFGFEVKIKKNIPLGTGLGGAASDAASVIEGINFLLDLGLKEKKLFSLGKKIGSDVNFFLSHSKFAFCWGRGERITPFKAKKLKHLIIWPKISLSTKRVYQNFQLHLTKYFDNVKILTYALKKGDIYLIKKNIFNALEKSAFSLCRELRDIKKYLVKKGIWVKMTGSGSALYTILERSSSLGYKGIFSKKWKVFEVQTI